MTYGEALEGVDLGAWAPYIADDLAVLYRFPVLPGVTDELRAYRPDGHEMDPLPSETFREMKRAARQYAHNSVENADPPGHRMAHFVRTHDGDMAILRHIERVLGVVFPEAVMQYSRVAADLHDCHHPRATLRSMASNRSWVWRPELEEAYDTVIVEWVSCIPMNALAKSFGVPLPGRVFMDQRVLCTTFGGGTDAGRQASVPNITPVETQDATATVLRGIFGTAIRAADVMLEPTIEEVLYYSHDILWGEVPTDPPPTSWEVYGRNRLGFLGYVSACYDGVDQAVRRMGARQLAARGHPAAFSLTQDMGWRDHFAQLRGSLEAMLRGENPALYRYIVQDLSRYGVTLTGVPSDAFL